jgi:RimJ/RimL family protein N-acetyltransferase
MTALSLLGPTLETARLILRPPEVQDFEPWAAMMQDEETARFIGGLQPPAMAWRAMRAMAGCWALDGFGMFSVIEKETGRWLGRLGPWKPHLWPAGEVGYGLVKEATGKGYATEGARAAGDWAISHLGWTHVFHCIHPRNVASQKVAARLGARNQGPAQLPAPYEGDPIDLWGQSAAEWRANNP